MPQRRGVLWWFVDYLLGVGAVSEEASDLPILPMNPGGGIPGTYGSRREQAASGTVGRG